MFGISLDRVEEIEQAATEARQRCRGCQLPVATHEILSFFAINRGHLHQTSQYEAIFDLRAPHPPYEILLRDKKPDQSDTGYRHRRRFTEGHELGHFFLHDGDRILHRETGETIVEAVADEDFELVDMENDANCFSGALLMPREAVRRDIELTQLHGGEFWLQSLSRKYDVSQDALEMRIARLKPGLVMSGYAKASDGIIVRLIPSLELEQLDETLAKAAWQCNRIVPGFVSRKLPPDFLRDFWSQYRALPKKDIATVRNKYRNIPLTKLLPAVSDGTCVEVSLWGNLKYNQKTESNLPMIYFEVLFAGVSLTRTVV